MIQQFSKLSVRTLPAVLSAVSGFSCQKETRTECEGDSSKNDPMRGRFNGETIDLTNANITEVRGSYGTNPALYLTTPSTENKSLSKMRCKYQQFPQDRINESFIGKVFSEIHSAAPLVKTLIAPCELFNIQSIHRELPFNCSQKLSGENLETFFEKTSLSSLSEEQVIMLMSDLIMNIRLDIALGKDIYVPNYFVLMDPENRNQVLIKGIVSLDHESAGENIYHKPCQQESIPSIEYCLSLITEDSSDELNNFLSNKRTREIIEKRSEQLLYRFTELYLDDIKREVISEFEGDFKDELENTVTIVERAQKRTAEWLMPPDNASSAAQKRGSVNTRI